VIGVGDENEWIIVDDTALPYGSMGQGNKIIKSRVYR
jgi:hypothetical protein